MRIIHPGSLAHNNYIRRLEAENADLLAALKAVEYVSIKDQERCPWCGGIRTDYPAKKLVKSVGFIVGHRVSCQRQQAIADAEAERKSPLRPCDVELPEGRE
jgi:hypothetical protein